MIKTYKLKKRIAGVLLFAALFTGCMDDNDVRETETEVHETEAEIHETEAEVHETEAEVHETGTETRETEAESHETNDSENSTAVESEISADEILSPSFAERLAGRYTGASDEEGKIRFEIYWMHDTLIAEAEEEYAAYYAVELIPDDPAVLSDPTAMEAMFTAYFFSGFSAEGAYWDNPGIVTVSLTESGMTWADADGTVMFYIRADSEEPIHPADGMAGFLENPSAHACDPEMSGLWEARTEDGYRMAFQLKDDGKMRWYCKKEGEPVSVCLGFAFTDADSGNLGFLTERVGWSNMPWMHSAKYTLTEDCLLLENAEEEGLLPVSGAVEFKRITEAE